jgi:hypothetical protein
VAGVAGLAAFGAVAGAVDGSSQTYMHVGMKASAALLIGGLALLIDGAKTQVHVTPRAGAR